MSCCCKFCYYIHENSCKHLQKLPVNPTSPYTSIPTSPRSLIGQGGTRHCQTSVGFVGLEIYHWNRMESAMCYEPICRSWSTFHERYSASSRASASASASGALLDIMISLPTQERFPRGNFIIFQDSSWRELATKWTPGIWNWNHNQR